MRNQILLLFLFCTPIFLAGCSNSNNDNFDLSNLKIPSQIKNKTSQTDINSPIINKKDNIINKLVAYPKVSQILDSARFGKNDPFSEEDITVNNLTYDFKLTGFLSTKINKYVFVSYLGREGSITTESIGGVNTFLLPNGAKVIKIEPKNMKLIINFENENFIFEM